MRNLLLAVCGLSPQILTETLYVLHARDQFPERVILLTTAKGADCTRSALLGKHGRMEKFLRDFSIPAHANPLADRDIFVPSLDNQPVADITSLAESTAFQKLAMHLVFDLTQDPTTRIDFCIAGGRKTMSAILALCAQCYGRARDRMFHVLVDLQKEADPLFFYPRPDERKELVTLAPLPFPRLRSLLPQSLLTSPLLPEEILQYINLSQTQSLFIYLSQRLLCLNGNSCQLSPALFALFLWFARHKSDCPCQGECLTCIKQTCFAELSTILAAGEGIKETYLRSSKGVLAKSTTGILNLTAENFMAYKAKLNRRLRENFGPFAGELFISGIGRKPGVRYGLTISKKQLRFIES